MADTGGGQKSQGGADFGVDLQSLANAIAVVKRERDNISGTLEQISGKMYRLSFYWKGPAYDSFEPVETWYKNAARDLLSVLDEIILRLQKTYDNYYGAESQNATNVTASTGRSDVTFYRSVRSPTQ